MTKFFLLDLILFLIIGGVAIILQYHFGNRLSKKVEIVYGCISVVIVAVTSTVFAIKMNPIISSISPRLKSRGHKYFINKFFFHALCVTMKKRWYTTEHVRVSRYSTQ